MALMFIGGKSNFPDLLKSKLGKQADDHTFIDVSPKMLDQLLKAYDRVA